MESTAFPSWKRQKTNFGVFATFLVFFGLRAFPARANDVAPRTVDALTSASVQRFTPVASPVIVKSTPAAKSVFTYSIW